MTYGSEVPPMSNAGSSEHCTAVTFKVCVLKSYSSWEKKITDVVARVRPRFFDQVGHQTTNASIGNKYFFTKQCHCQTYQNYEQSWQKLGTFLVNKVL